MYKTTFKLYSLLNAHVYVVKTTLKLCLSHNAHMFMWSRRPLSCTCPLMRMFMCTRVALVQKNCLPICGHCKMLDFFKISNDEFSDEKSIITKQRFFSQTKAAIFYNVKCLSGIFYYFCPLNNVVKAHKNLTHKYFRLFVGLRNFLNKLTHLYQRDGLKVELLFFKF